jgi:two-component system sensor histidine kinase ChvG
LTIAGVRKNLAGLRSRLRRATSRISNRLLAFNLLLVFLPAAGILYLNVYERQLLSALEVSMVQQGRILAAALGDEGAIDPRRATLILERLERRLNARIRVLDREGWVIADSSQMGPRLPPELLMISGRPYGDAEAAAADASRKNPLYQIGSGIYNVFRRAFGPPEGAPLAIEPYPADKPLRIPPVERALTGKYGASTLISPGQRSVTLYSAIPVRSGRDVVGVVLVSGTTLRILGDLYQVRLAVFQVVLASMLVAVLLTIIARATIVRPLHRLRGEALALVDNRGRLRGTFGGSGRTDEIGDLARALEDLSRRLAEHLAFVEAFAGDVSHELKNPLASIRNAAEMLEDVEEPEERREMLDIVQREVARLEHLLKEVREMARLDAQVEGEARPTVQLEALLPALVEGVRRRAPDGVTLELELPDSGLHVRAAPERLAQVAENLLDNAVSFAPAGTAVSVRLARTGAQARLTVRDRGPGVPPQHLERVWARFFSYRPAGTGDGKPHTGLGLAIVKAIVEGYGGTVSASNAAEGGAVFEVGLPLAS